MALGDKIQYINPLGDGGYKNMFGSSTGTTPVRRGSALKKDAPDMADMYRQREDAYVNKFNYSFNDLKKSLMRNNYCTLYPNNALARRQFIIYEDILNDFYEECLAPLKEAIDFLKSEKESTKLCLEQLETFKKEGVRALVDKYAPEFKQKPKRLKKNKNRKNQFETSAPMYEPNPHPWDLYKQAVKEKLIKGVKPAEPLAPPNPVAQVIQHAHPLPNGMVYIDSNDYGWDASKNIQHQPIEPLVHGDDIEAFENEIRNDVANHYMSEEEKMFKKFYNDD